MRGVPHCNFDCISLITRGDERLFMSLLTISTSPLEKYLLRPFAHFLMGSFVFELYELFVYFRG